jgi:protein-S-isoprenylcysteine O-methyltransferase Ste14
MREHAGSLLKTALFTVVVPGTVAGYLPWSLLQRETAWLPFGPLRWIGAPVLLFGLAVYLRCAWDFATAGRGTPLPLDAPKELVVRGLYRWMRNPMYVGVLSVILGVGLLSTSRSVLSYFAIVFLVFHLVVVLYEEQALASRFGESYARYRRQVPRWIPRRP